MTPLAVGVLGKDPALKRVFTAKFAHKFCASTRSTILAYIGDFCNQSLEATVVFIQQFLSGKNEYFCLQDFLETKVFSFGAPKLYHTRHGLSIGINPYVVFSHT